MPTSLLVPTPPASSRRIAATANTAIAATATAATTSHSGEETSSSAGAVRGESINTQRRKSLLVASQLNAIVQQQQQSVLHEKDDQIQKEGNILTTLEPPHPIQVFENNAEIELTQPIRRNSWVVADEAIAATSTETAATATTASTAPTAISELTLVEALVPPVSSEVLASPALATQDGAHPIFATEAAAHNYSRMLRRASWPLNVASSIPSIADLLQQPPSQQPSSHQLDNHDVQQDTEMGVQNRVRRRVLPIASGAHTMMIPKHGSSTASISTKVYNGSYRPTPVSTPVSSPRHGAAAAASSSSTSNTATTDAEQQENLGEISLNSNVPSSTSAAPLPPPPAASSSSTTISRPSSIVAAAPSPLVNLLLLGDESCGLGEALDEFAGRDRNVGLTFKTRKIHLLNSKQSKNDATSSSSSQLQQEESKQSGDDAATELYRVRCWHTPGLAPDSTRSLAPYLRHVHSIALIYDVMDLASFEACEKWFELLIVYATASTANSSMKMRPIILVGNTARFQRAQMMIASQGVQKRHSVLLPSQMQQLSAAAALAHPASSLTSSHPMQQPQVAQESDSFAVVDSASSSSSSSSTTTATTTTAAANSIMRFPTRRSSLPHAGTLYLQPQQSHAKPVHAVATDSYKRGHSTADAGDRLSRVVSNDRVSSFLHRIRAAYTKFGAVDSVEINANLWRDRYRVFESVAGMVKQLGPATSQNNSRPVSPVNMKA